MSSKKDVSRVRYLSQAKLEGFSDDRKHNQSDLFGRQDDPRGNFERLLSKNFIKKNVVLLQFCKASGLP